MKFELNFKINYSRFPREREDSKVPEIKFLVLWEPTSP